jgi:hypothetical protein
VIEARSSQSLRDDIEDIREIARAFDKARWRAYIKLFHELQAIRRQEWDERSMNQEDWKFSRHFTAGGRYECSLRDQDWISLSHHDHWCHKGRSDVLWKEVFIGLANRFRERELENDKFKGKCLHYSISHLTGRAKILNPCQTLTVIIP